MSATYLLKIDRISMIWGELLREKRKEEKQENEYRHKGEEEEEEGSTSKNR